MTTLTIPQYEPADFGRIPQSLSNYCKAISIIAGFVLATALMTAGTILLLMHHAAAVILVAAPTLVAWAVLFILARALLKRKPPSEAALRRRATVMSPTQIELGGDRITVRMPVGYSKFNYSRVAQWREGPTACYLIIKGAGAFFIPRRCVAEADLRAAAIQLKDRGVRIKIFHSLAA